MNSKKKKSIISFESVLVSQIPVCRQGYSGIRPGTIRQCQRVIHKENSQSPIETTLNNLTVRTSRECKQSSIYKSRTIRPSSVSYEVHGTPLQVAYYNFLPDLEDTSISSPRPYRKRIVKENKYLHKFFDKTLKPGAFEASDLSMTVTKVTRCSNSIQKLNEQEIEPRTLNNCLPARPEYSDSEEGLAKEFNQLLKPKFNE